MARKILPKPRVSRDAPPKILYLVGFLAYASWFGWGYLLFNFPPDPVLNRLLFLGALFTALLFSFLFLFYEGGKLLTGKSSSLVFYPAMRRALLLALFFSLSAGMRILGIANWLNLSLLGLVLLLSEIQISRR